ncbi:MAG: SET domain-containing protein-lysine N-methyltransferase [candidate division Zixibacteria bacterium CG_4_9_14_3_um_filter_46_8]|nr:MAG: SET domain-containing protein-lysine N-methyltransferase [candidate division Zixibacteria bacterium CG_4_9_14_3_um_filter_46_8]
MGNKVALKIRAKKSRIHGTGVFATSEIENGTRIIEYVGEKISKAESDRRYEKYENIHPRRKDKGRVYLFTLNKRHDIDGDVPYNLAKYINHSCEANCESEIFRGHIWIVATRDISPGEEITYNYGYDYDCCEDHPCYCGSAKCIGFILAKEHWPKLRRKLRNRAVKPNRKA